MTFPYPVPIRVLALFTVLAASASTACGGSSTENAGTGDAGSDGSTNGDGLSDGLADGLADGLSDGLTDGAPSFPPCGDGPYFTYSANIGEITAADDVVVLSSAILTFDECPSLKLTPDGKGRVSASLSKGKPFTVRVTADKHITVIGPERLVPKDDALTGYRENILLPVNLTDAVPQYIDSAPSFAFIIEPTSTAVKPCNEVDKVTFDIPTGVKGHFMLVGWPKNNADPLSEGVSIGPVVFFTGVTSSSVAGIVAHKTSCAMNAKGAPTYQTGNYKLENGAWTYGNVDER